jgi:hypothetical protein
VLCSLAWYWVLGLCVCVCVYVRACVWYVCMCMHTCMHMCMYLCVHVHMHVCKLSKHGLPVLQCSVYGLCGILIDLFCEVIETRTPAEKTLGWCILIRGSTHTRARMRTHAQVQARAQTGTWTHRHGHTHTHTYTDIQTHTHCCLFGPDKSVWDGLASDSMLHYSFCSHSQEGLHHSLLMWCCSYYVSYCYFQVQLPRLEVRPCIPQ